ncbi:MAG: hypothetical protein ACTSVI_05975 [Promethearchaeota archaeon]
MINERKLSGSTFILHHKKKRRFIKKVFKVGEPECPSCHEKLEFYLFENYKNTGIDYVQWRCSSNCGFYKNVEIL